MCLKTFSYKDYNFSYSDNGNPAGFPIIIQHGLIASIKDSSLFQSLIEADRRVIAIARPGYGESDPYQLSQISDWGKVVGFLVDNLHINEFDQLGTSSGAPYCYAIAYINSSKVRSTYIFSGIPALYDEQIAAHWPFPLNKEAQIKDLQVMAKEVFFPNISENSSVGNDISDSMKHHCFGMALDFQIRCKEWGFSLSQIHTAIYMQHAIHDNQVPFITAEMTSKLLPKCEFEPRESGDHFSKDLIDAFIKNSILRIST